MFSKTQKATNDMVFRVPLIGMDMTWRQIIEYYPHLNEEMNGSDPGCFLSVYYIKNPVNGIYDFVDEDAEADLTDIYGFDLDICTKGESKEEKFNRDAHIDQITAFEDDDEFNNLEEFDEDFEKEEVKKQKNQKKLEKQQRRNLVLQSRAIKVET